MMRVLPRRVLVACIPSALLCVVALHHAYRVSREGLTPWKGGGFGMFSTIDSQAERFVRLSLVFLSPFLYVHMYAGDAEVHLVYGENAAHGHYSHSGVVRSRARRFRDRTPRARDHRQA